LGIDGFKKLNFQAHQLKKKDRKLEIIKWKEALKVYDKKT
jgi:hypothetical protein